MNSLRLFIVLILLGHVYGIHAQNPADAALCFYQWYLQAIKNPIAAAHTAVVKMGIRGEVVLDYERYFQNLDSIACVSDSFKRAEVLRFQPCQDFFKDIPYEVYYDQIDNHAFTYDAPCPFFTQFHWVSDLQYWTLAGVTESKMEGPKAWVQLALSSGKQRQQKEVHLHLDKGEWKVVKIQ
jgi:hypothetical protein